MRAAAALAFVVACAASRGEVYVEPAAPEIERFAAAELERYLHDLFGGIGGHKRIRFVVGSSKTTPEIARALSTGRLALPEEGYAIVPLPSQRTLLLAGGSPRASLWAVYDLVERWGVRFLLHGDVKPERPAFLFPRKVIQRNPVFAIRQWRVVNELAFGPASWGSDDYRLFLDQLAKLRFNRILVSLWPHQPFLRYSFGGIARQSSSMFFGQRFPLPPQMPGRSAFPDGWSEFHNPDIPPSLSHEERLTAGIAHIRKVMEHARKRGFEIVISANISDFPREFGAVLKDSRPVRQVGALTVAPGPGTRLNDDRLLGLSRQIVHAILDTYPEASRIALSTPEHRQWTSEFERAWSELDARYELASIASLDSLLRRAGERKDFHGGKERAENEVKGDIVTLYFYDRLLRDEQVRQKLARSGTRLVFSSVAEELSPLLTRILPSGSELLSFIDYTPSRVLSRADRLRAAPARTIPSALIFTLHDDNVGLLPQLATRSLAALSGELAQTGWQGFSTRYWLTGDHEPAVAWLAKAGWDWTVSVNQAYRDLLTRLCGLACVPDATIALAALERATAKLEWHGLGFAFPVEGMLMKHWRADALPAEVLSVREDYQNGLAAVRRAMAKASHRNAELAYLAGRLEFGIAYLETTRLVQAAAAQEKADNRSAAASAAVHAVERLRAGIEAWARVARDQSDRGGIASLFVFAYEPLRAKGTALQAPE